jgi:filamentous hemagglutinin
LTTGQSAQRQTPKSKVVEYLLNEDHPVGSAKAAFFRRFGFSREQWQVMATALNDHPERNPVKMTTTNEYGTKHLVRCRIVTPDGRNPCIDTVWMTRGGTTTLVTAYPASEA